MGNSFVRLTDLDWLDTLDLLRVSNDLLSGPIDPRIP